MAAGALILPIVLLAFRPSGCIASTTVQVKDHQTQFCNTSNLDMLMAQEMCLKTMLKNTKSWKKIKYKNPDINIYIWRTKWKRLTKLTLQNMTKIRKEKFQLLSHAMKLQYWGKKY